MLTIKNPSEYSIFPEDFCQIWVLLNFNCILFLINRYKLIININLDIYLFRKIKVATRPAFLTYLYACLILMELVRILKVYIAIEVRI